MDVEILARLLGKLKWNSAPMLAYAYRVCPEKSYTPLILKTAKPS